METMATDRKVWTAVETRALISLKDEMKTKFLSMKRNRALWVELAEKLQKVYGHHRTASQCAVRWKNIMSSYKECRESVQREDSSPKICSFFKEVEAVVGDPPLSQKDSSNKRIDQKLQFESTESTPNTTNGTGYSIQERRKLHENTLATTKENDTNTIKGEVTEQLHESKDERLFNLLNRLITTVQNHSEALERIEAKLSKLPSSNQQNHPICNIEAEVEASPDSNLQSSLQTTKERPETFQGNGRADVAALMDIGNNSDDNIEPVSNRNNNQDVQTLESAAEVIVVEGENEDCVNILGRVSTSRDRSENINERNSIDDIVKQSLPDYIEHSTHKDQEKQSGLMENINVENNSKVMDHSSDDLELNHGSINDDENPTSPHASPAKNSELAEDSDVMPSPMTFGKRKSACEDAMKPSRKRLRARNSTQ